MSRGLQRNADGERIELGPNEVVIRLSGAETDGAFSLLEYTAPPDGPSPATHVHEATDEVIYVLDGELAGRVEAEAFTAGAGDSVWIPRGRRHSFEVAGTRDAWFLLWYAPAGFEGYFEELGEFLESQPAGAPDPDAIGRKVAELSERYDQTLVETGG